MEHITILGISGSLRAGSYNTALLRAAAEIAPDDMSIENVSLSGLPLFNSDLESEHLQLPEVRAFRSAVAEADGLLIASPEYNFSVTGALKNAVDWASRSGDLPGPPLDLKPAAILGAGGRFGTLRSQMHLRDMLLHNDVRTVNTPQVMIDAPSTKFDSDLRLTAERHRDQIARLLDALRTLVIETRNPQD